MLRAAAEAAVDEQLARMRRKEIRAARTAVRKYLEKQDVEGFEQWLTEWYDKHVGELHDAVGPSMEVWLMVSGAPAETVAVEAAADCRRRAAAACGQLAGVLREAEPQDKARAVMRRLAEWEANANVRQ